MRLIGMLDSPYVRRVAISFTLMDLRFSHEPVSVFRHFGEFAQINPVVKAPTLVTDDVVLMESSLILDYAQHLASPERHLMPAQIGMFARAQRIIISRTGCRSAECRMMCARCTCLCGALRSAMIAAKRERSSDERMILTI